MQINLLELIFQKWKAELRLKDKGRDFVEENFTELFEELKRANVPFAEAHEALGKAIKEHLPSPAIAKNTYKKSKTFKNISGFTEEEFIKNWHEEISAKGTRAFFSIYPRPKEADEDDTEPKIYGGGKISAREYRMQRDHADKFETISIKDIPDPVTDFMTEEELLEFLKRQSHE